MTDNRFRQTLLTVSKRPEGQEGSMMTDNYVDGRRLSKWDPRLWWDLIGQGNSPWTVFKAGLRGFPGLPR